MYPEQLVAPMRNDLTSVGFTEFKTPEQVEDNLNNQKGTTLLVINSVCGCAAGAARPGVKWALQHTNKKPSQLATVFAGVDKEAVAKAREFTLPYPPSSPSIALSRMVSSFTLLNAHHIEGRNAQMIGEHLLEVFEEYC